jgi:hypothetical protein
MSTDQDISSLRSKFLDATEDDIVKGDFRAAFASDFNLWMRLCGWTYAPKEVDLESGREVPSTRPHRPFVLWPCQERAALEIISCVEGGRDIAVRKSRDMGASWLLASVSCWGWLFKGWQTLLVSRVEDGVDRPGDPDSLLWKVDYLLQSQPPWLLPGNPDDLLKRGSDTRQHMMLRNPVSGATITGQASTAHVGRGGRRTMVLFDEFASMGDAEAAWRSAADATACRVAVSTPLGSGTHYATLVRQSRSTGDPRLVELLYTDHPLKGANPENRVDLDGRVTGVAGSDYVWTPWLAEQLKRRDTIDMAQNVFATEIGSGSNFFTPGVVTSHMNEYGNPGERCEVLRGRFVADPNGRWRVFRHGDIHREYVMFADPSYGTGSANAAICVMDAHSREVVAEFADPNIPPHDLAIDMVELAMTVYRGARHPLIGWEVNGPGAAMHHDFLRIGYHEVYRQRIVGTSTERRTVRYGWNSSRRAKRTILSSLSRAISQNEIVIPSEDTLREMLDYVILEDGGIEAGSVRDLSSGARESHGDRVIALAGALMLCEEAASPQSTEPSLPSDSLGVILNHQEVFK